MNRSTVLWIAFGLVGFMVFVFFLRTEPTQLTIWEDDVIAASEAYRKREFAEAEKLLETAVKKAERLPAKIHSWPPR